MKGREIERFISAVPKLKSFMLPVCSIDNLPCKITKFPFGIIFNSDVLSGPGKHWICLYSEKEGHVEFFDSLGFDINHYNENLRKFIERNEFICISNTFRVQSKFSISCGFYTLFYVLMRARGYSMRNITDCFENVIFS